MKFRFLLLTFALFLTFGVLQSCKDKIDDPNATQFVDNEDGTITVIDKGQGIGSTTLTADKIWILEGLVFVNDGQELTIEAGTLIKGKPGTGENASALIVARGGKINAVGTATSPIVFTALADNYAGTGVDLKAQGLWGGVLILGKATSNNLTTEKAIEGIPTSETRGLFGGSNDADNSGVLKYVSIRHGGTDIGEGNEINGLTLGCVGSATTIEYVEVISNKDDGIELFGGAVMIKNAVVAYCGDDSFDYDEGWHGKGQFWYVCQDENGDRIGEHDGGPSDNQLGAPYSLPIIYNVTYWGGKAESSKTVTLRENAGCVYANSIFVNQTKGIDIEYRQDEGGALAGSCYKMWQDGNLEIKNNVFYDIAGIMDLTGEYASTLFKISVPKDANDQPLYSVPDDLKAAFVAYFDQAGNTVANPGISATNPVPTTAQTTNLASYPTGFQSVTYKGAFGTSNWAEGWTLLFN